MPPEGVGVGFGLVLRVALGCSVFAAVSFSHVDGSALVLVIPCGGGVVRPQCWSAFGVGFGRPACAVVSFQLFLGSADRVRKPSRHLADMWEVCDVSTPCLNIAPRIQAAKSSGWRSRTFTPVFTVRQWGSFRLSPLWWRTEVYALNIRKTRLLALRGWVRGVS